MIAPFYAVEPMRVRRGYRGGALLERRAGRAAADTDRPEDWIASTVAAVNPGLPPEPGEGLTRLRDPRGGATSLDALLRAEARAVLGPAGNLGFLAKLLDAAMRLHVQAHPTRAFARERLGAPWGKLEVYVILAVRPGCDGWIRLGFQRSPGRDGWRRIVERQDIAAMDACFDRIPVAVGETWLVPGGWPHAIGPGVLMLEVMEPSDLVVRCEFEREGLVVPPAGRFMGRDLEFCLDVFDYAPRDVAAVRAACRTAASPVAPTAGAREDLILDPARSGCFAIRRIQLAAGASAEIARGGLPALVLAESGAPRLAADGETLALATLDAAVVPAATARLRVSADAAASVLVVQPGA